MAMPGIMGERAERCVLLEKTRVPDGEGGWQTTWVDGMEFSAAIAHSSSIEARVAESEGMSSTFTVWTEKGFVLDFHDVFRASDGQVYRVTSQGGDDETPDSADMQVQHVSAERWQLT